MTKPHSTFNSGQYDAQMLHLTGLILFTLAQIVGCTSPSTVDDGGVDSGTPVEPGDGGVDSGTPVERLVLATARLYPCSDAPQFTAVGGGGYFECTPCGLGVGCATSAEGMETIDFVVNVPDGSLPPSPDGKVTGWAGQLRWSSVRSPTAVVAFHAGGDGSQFFGEPYPAVPAAVVAHGGRTVEVSWQSPDGLFGWTSRAGGVATTMRALSQRPAAVFDWVNAYLNPEDNQLGLVGCSRGSDAVFASRYWHGLDPIIDYMMLSGGPPSADVYESCQARPVSEAGGLCALEVDTEGDLPICHDDADCGGNLCDAWQFGTQGDNKQQHRMDHIHLGTSCVDGTPNEAFRDSSFIHTEGDWDASYPIDFLQTHRVAGGTGADDDFGVLVPGQEVYRRLSSSKRYRGIPGENRLSHCRTVFISRANATFDILLERMDDLR